MLAPRRWDYFLACLYVAGVFGVLFVGLVGLWLFIGTLVGLWLSLPEMAAQLDEKLGRSTEAMQPEQERIP